MSTRRHSEVYPTESIFGERSYEPEHFEVLSKALRRVVKSVSKKSVSAKKICRACENICESPIMTSKYSMYPVESKVCRVCEKVCEKENVYGKSFEQKLLKKMIKSSKYERVLF